MKQIIRIHLIIILIAFSLTRSQDRKSFLQNSRKLFDNDIMKDDQEANQIEKTATPSLEPNKEVWPETDNTLQNTAQLLNNDLLTNDLNLFSQLDKLNTEMNSQPISESGIPSDVLNELQEDLSENQVKTEALLSNEGKSESAGLLDELLNKLLFEEAKPSQEVNSLDKNDKLDVDMTLMEEYLDKPLDSTEDETNNQKLKDSEENMIKLLFPPEVTANLDIVDVAKDSAVDDNQLLNKEESNLNELQEMKEELKELLNSLGETKPEETSSIRETELQENILETLQKEAINKKSIDNSKFSQDEKEQMSMLEEDGLIEVSEEELSKIDKEIEIEEITAEEENISDLKLVDKDKEEAFLDNYIGDNKKEIENKEETEKSDLDKEIEGVEENKGPDEQEEEQKVEENEDLTVENNTATEVEEVSNDQENSQFLDEETVNEESENTETKDNTGDNNESNNNVVEETKQEEQNEKNDEVKDNQSKVDESKEGKENETVDIKEEKAVIEETKTEEKAVIEETKTEEKQTEPLDKKVEEVTNSSESSRVDRVELEESLEIKKANQLNETTKGSQEALVKTSIIETVNEETRNDLPIVLFFCGVLIALVLFVCLFLKCRESKRRSVKKSGKYDYLAEMEMMEII